MSAIAPPPAKRLRQTAHVAFPFGVHVVDNMMSSLTSHRAVLTEVGRRNNVYSFRDIGAAAHSLTNLNVGGEARFAEMQRTFLRMGRQMKFAFEDFQVSVLMDLCLMCVDLIYRDEYLANPKKVLDRHKLKKLEIGTLIVAERRIGKTIMTAAFILVLAMFVPGTRIAVFSIGSRASSGLREWVDKFIKGLGIERRVVEANVERLAIAARDLPIGATVASPIARSVAKRGDTSILLFLPGAGDSESLSLYLSLSFPLSICLPVCVCVCMWAICMFYSDLSRPRWL